MESRSWMTTCRLRICDWFVKKSGQIVYEKCKFTFYRIQMAMQIRCYCNKGLDDSEFNYFFKLVAFARVFVSSKRSLAA